MQDELKPWTKEHLKSALVNLIEASKNSVRGPERGGPEHAISGIFQQIVAAWNTRAPTAPEGWRDIESAPKDGTCVLLRATRGQMIFPKPETVVGRFDRGWWTPDSNLTYVTHWMPLPAAPKVTT